MLKSYLAHCGPHSTFLDVISINTPVSNIGEDDSEFIPEIVDTIPSPYPDPEAEFEQQDLLNKIGLFMDTLPDHLKLVARMHYWDELTQTEISHRLGVTQSAISQRLNKIVTRGRDYFDLTMH